MHSKGYYSSILIFLAEMWCFSVTKLDENTLKPVQICYIFSDQINKCGIWCILLFMCLGVWYAHSDAVSCGMLNLCVYVSPSSVLLGK